MSSVYSPRGQWGAPPLDETRCVASIHSNYRSHQCKNKATIHECRKVNRFEEPDDKVYGWCKTHAPSAEKAKSDARNARWDAELKASERARKATDLRNAIVDEVLGDVDACPPKVQKLARKLIALGDA